MTKYMIQSLCGNWRFFPEGGAAATITVPSHWTHGIAWGYPPEWESVERAAYEREVSIPPLVDGASAWLRFEAVLLKARVFLDGTEIGAHAGGFTPFECEATAYAGRTVTLRVEVESAASAYGESGIEHPISYTPNKEEGPVPGGIWQPVHLVVRPPVYSTGHWIQTSVREGAVTFCTSVVSHLTRPRRVRVRFTNPKGTPDAFCFLDETVVMEPGGELNLTHRSPLGDLPLWSPASPRMLVGEIRVEDAEVGTLLFVAAIRFGLREFRSEGRDFYLNGKKTHLLGTSLVRHRISPHLWRRDYLRLLFAEFKKLGINCLRTHGSLCPEVVLDCADECGLMIENQSALWSDAVFGYYAAGEVFLKNAQSEFQDWFRRDRNHPSVVIWDVENEQLRILPEALPMVQRLIDTLKGEGAREPIAASGCSGMNIGDIHHLHCGPNPMAVVRRWAQSPSNRPFIHGEWWADTTRMNNSRTYLFDGVAGATRVPSFFNDAGDVLEAAGYLYAKEFLANRLWGVSGTIGFSFEALYFEPLFAPGQKIALPSADDECADFNTPDHFEGEGLHVLRRPYVNPGWTASSEKIPTVHTNPRSAPYFREALAPFLVGFREESRHAAPDGSLCRTLVLLNDTESPASGTVRLFFDNHTSAFWQTDFKLTAGELQTHGVETIIPVDAPRDRPLGIRAEWTLGVTNGRREMVRITPPVLGPRPGDSPLTDVPVGVSGVAPETLAWLEANCPSLRPLKPSDVPSPDTVWIIGPTAAPSAEAVAAFLKDGGRALVLRREGQCGFLPPVLEHVSSLRAAGPIERPWGFASVGRECSAIEELPVADPNHPALAGITPHPTPACPHGALLHWNAGDGRLADDVLRIPSPKDGPAAGHLRSLLGATATDQSTLVEWRSGESRLIFCQLHLEDNLNKTPEAARIFGNLVCYLARPCVAPRHFAYFTDPGSATVPDWLPPFLEATGAAELHLLQTADLARVLREAANSDSPLGTFLRAGGRAMVIPPLDGPFTEGPLLDLPDDAPLVTSSKAGCDPLLAGLSPAFLEAFIDSRGLLSLPSEPEDEALVRVHRAPLVSPIAGLNVSQPLAALWRRRQVGKGELHLCAFHFGGEPEQARNLATAVLGNAGVPVTMPTIRPPAVPLFDLFCTKRPLPLDGDLDKWTNTEADHNIAPWSRSQRAVLTPCEDPALPGIGRLYQDNRCAALAYALWDVSAVYAAVLSIAPAFSPAPRKDFIWDYSACEFQIGFTRILFGIDTTDLPRFVVSGPSDGDPAERLRLKVRDFGTPPQHSETAALYLREPETLNARLYEIAIPWAFLDRDAPQPGEVIDLGFKSLICQEPGATKIGDLVAPATLLSSGGKPFAATVRDMRNV